MANVTRSVAAGISALLVLSGCAATLEGGQPATPGPQALRAMSLYDGYQANYLVKDTPAELAKLSQLAVTGVVAEIREGRQWDIQDDPWPAVTSAIVVVKQVDVAAGDLPSKSDGNVYVELTNSTNLPLKQFVAAIPVGSPVAFYLSPVPATGEHEEIIDPGPNKTIDDQLFIPVSPQGFAIEVPSEKTVVWPMLGATYSGTIQDASPSGRLLPSD